MDSVNGPPPFSAPRRALRESSGGSTFAGEGYDCATGRNLGSAISSETSSNTTSTGIPM